MRVLEKHNNKKRRVAVQCVGVSMFKEENLKKKRMTQRAGK